MKRDHEDDHINSAAAAANRDRDVLAGYRAHAASFGALAKISLLLPEPWAGEVDDYDAIVKAVARCLDTSLSIAEANHIWQERLCPLHTGCDHEICRSIRAKLDRGRGAA